MDDEALAEAVNAALIAESEDDGVFEGASEETIAAAEEPEPVQVAPIKLEPVYAFPLHGLFVAERSYADFEDMGLSEGGTLRAGTVLGTAEVPKYIQMRGSVVLFRDDAGDRWKLYQQWYRFFRDDQDIVAIISSTDNDPRVANLQAMQQADSVRETLFASGRSSERLNPAPERDWTNFP